MKSGDINATAPSEVFADVLLLALHARAHDLGRDQFDNLARTVLLPMLTPRTSPKLMHQVDR
jgi:hypothetical protein